MRILFGAEHDGLHINPSDPNGYEWWYFDAISDDERYILVVIFFLGTPMSPYYKAVVDGKDPLPKDWCGVFVSLHERTATGYRERAYAYNLYTENLRDLANAGSMDAVNYFRDAPLDIKLGESTLRGSYSHDGRRFTHYWTIALNERNLWFGATKAELKFATPFLLSDQPAIESDDQSHTWVCVAPDCDVSGTVTLASGQSISFTGRGYHDHNFGRLPWSDTPVWYWGRTHFARDKPVRGIIEYRWLARMTPHAVVVTWASNGATTVVQNGTTDIDMSQVLTRRKRPFVHTTLTGIEQTGLQSVKVSESLGWSLLQTSPFYKRFPVVAEVAFTEQGTGSYIGIGELFQPARLTGSIISRMMWTRIRRRS